MDDCNHAWHYTGSKRQQAWQCAYCCALRFDKPKERDNDLTPDWAMKELARAYELLERCETEMRYAGWNKYESDNSARNGVYEQVKHFLGKECMSKLKTATIPDHHKVQAKIILNEAIDEEPDSVIVLCFFRDKGHFKIKASTAPDRLAVIGALEEAKNHVLVTGYAQ